MTENKKVPVFKMVNQYSDMGAEEIGTIEYVENVDAIISADDKGRWIAIVGIAKMDNPDNYVQIHDSFGDIHKFKGHNRFGILVSDKLAAYTIFANCKNELFDLSEFARLKGLTPCYITADDVESDEWVNKEVEQ
jgi:hypothetical protein